MKNGGRNCGGIRLITYAEMGRILIF